MRNLIFYYTGTGNSLFVARTLANELGDTSLVSITGWTAKAVDTDYETIGLIFPVHAWGLPSPIIKFIKQLGDDNHAYVYAIAVNAGQISATLVQLMKVLRHGGIVLACGFDLQMPSNYIPWGGPGPKEERERKFDLAKTKISLIANCIKHRERRPVEKGPLWQRLLFTPLYKMTLSQFPKLDRNFWVDNKCNSCVICYKVCPAQNITMEQGKPTWHHRCEQCFACLQWCPREAIQYGSKTPRYERYHHPEIKLEDMIRNRN